MDVFIRFLETWPPHCHREEQTVRYNVNWTITCREPWGGKQLSSIGKQGTGEYCRVRGLGSASVAGSLAWLSWSLRTW